MSNKKRKSLKRHKSLQPLSRHHMEALHLGLKLRRAGTDDSLLTPEEIQQEVKEFWEPNGQEHFREEEEILLPAFAQHASIDRPEIIEMLYRTCESPITCQSSFKNDSSELAILHELGELLEVHVRKEGRIIFELIQKELPDEVLVELEPYIHD